MTECSQHPLIYKSNNLNDDRFQILAMHLNQLIKKGVLLIDDKGRFVNSLNEYVSLLPDNKKTQVYKAFNILKSKNRIKKVSTNAVLSVNECKTKYCDDFYSIMNERIENCIIDNNCIGKIKGNLITEISTLNNYSTSKLYNNLEQTSKTIDRTVSLESFNKEIIVPLIKYTNVLKVYDRVFANSMKDNINGVGVQGNFKSGLEFLLNIIEEYNENEDFIFELYTSIHNGARNRQYKEIRDSLIDYFNTLKKKYAFKINIYVKDNFNGFPHSRHFITDQIGITVDKGLDLLNSSGQLNDNIFTIMNEEDIRKKEQCRSYTNIIKV